MQKEHFNSQQKKNKQTEGKLYDIDKMKQIISHLPISSGKNTGQLDPCSFSSEMTHTIR